MSMGFMAVLMACGVLAQAYAAVFHGHRSTAPATVSGLSPRDLPAPAAEGVDQEGRRFITTLPADPHQAVPLRRIVRETLRAWQLHHLVQDSMLITHELFSNAVEHGSTSPEDDVTIELQLLGAELRIAVTDRTPDRAPTPSMTGPEDERGRGLEIVNSLAASWHVVSQPLRKTVWAILPAQRPSD